MFLMSILLSISRQAVLAVGSVHYLNKGQKASAGYTKVIVLFPI